MCFFNVPRPPHTGNGEQIEAFGLGWGGLVGGEFSVRHIPAPIPNSTSQELHPDKTRVRKPWLE
eukprot:1442586-Pyramimonas_sp.AAC.1